MVLSVYSALKLCKLFSCLAFTASKRLGKFIIPFL